MKWNGVVRPDYFTNNYQKKINQNNKIKNNYFGVGLSDEGAHDALGVSNLCVAGTENL